MKKNKIALMLISAMAAAMPFSACTEDESSDAVKVDLTGITIKNVTCYVGDAVSIEKQFSPANANIRQLEFTSSDESVISVDNNGNIKATKKGTATITAKSVYYSNISATCTVTVNPSYIVFDANGGDGDVPEKIEIAEISDQNYELSKESNLTKDNSEFLGWGTKDGNVLESIKLEKQDTVWAVWTNNKYVDLGLTSKTLWATENLDGKYAWGETETKSAFTWDNYTLDTMVTINQTTYLNSTIYVLRKYITNEDMVSIMQNYEVSLSSDGITQLEEKDDAAIKNWGKNYAMPTQENIHELITECYWVYTENYNKTEQKGYIVYKAKSDNDRGIIASEEDSEYISADIAEDKDKNIEAQKADIHIFLPEGKYWSNQLSEEDDYAAYYMSALKEAEEQTKDLDDSQSTPNAQITDDETPAVGISIEERCKGLLIRPIRLQ